MAPVQNIAIIHKSGNIVFFMIFEPFLHTNALYLLSGRHLLFRGKHCATDHYLGDQILSLSGNLQQTQFMLKGTINNLTIFRTKSF